MKKASLKIDLPSGFDIEGHRGCRGLMPENTIPAFLKALELGVSTLEMDIVITADKQVLVSHDPFMSHEFCRSPEGKAIAAEEESSHNIYRMSFEQVSKYDCGLQPHPRFPQQKKIAVSKPLLKDVIDASEKFIRQHGFSVGYNIEIKSTLKGDGLFHPAPEEYTDLLMGVLKEKHTEARTIIQSFDVRPLCYLRKKYPAMVLSYLIENNQSPEQNISELGFVPEIYSLDYTLVNEQLMQYASRKNMKVLPWTVNDLSAIMKLSEMGVNGIITDYPNLLLK
jgi:glycerophosphoryl diester phosphodiesterase